MIKRYNKIYLVFGISVLVLTTLACGSIGFGVVSPEPDEDPQSIKLDPKTAVTETAPVEAGKPSDQEPTEVPPETQKSLQVTAWLGHIASLPEGSQYDDMVVLSPEGTGEYGLAGATPEVEAEIRSLRDAVGPHEYVHLWGTLNCEVPDYNGCQILINKLQYGANFSEEDANQGVGTIQRSTFNSSETFVFELSGDVPMWYSIYASQDEALKAEIESLSDTGALVQVSGRLLVGVPDVNGTRIEAAQLEVLGAGSEDVPGEGAEPFDPTKDWPVFVSDRYDYQIRYPQEAVISLFGPEGFSMEDVPSDMTPEQYKDSLEKEYTNQLCVQIEYALGWIYIAAPPNMEKFLNPCGPTGLGAGEIISKIETITIGDQLFQAHGAEFRLLGMDAKGNPITGETLDLHGEMFRVELENGFVIRFGSWPRSDAVYDDYIMKTKNTLIQIIGTFETTP